MVKYFTLITPNTNQDPAQFRHWFLREHAPHRQDAGGRGTIAFALLLPQPGAAQGAAQGFSVPGGDAGAADDEVHRVTAAARGPPYCAATDGASDRNRSVSTSSICSGRRKASA